MPATTTMPETKAQDTLRPALLAPVPLTQVTVNETGGQLVLTSQTGDYDIDQQHGVIHCNAFPPAIEHNGGPDSNHTYVLRGLGPGGNPVAFAGLIFVGRTSTGIYKFAYNMSRLEDATAEAFPAPQTAVTNMRIASQRKEGLVATAATGEYLHAPGHPSQVIAIDAQNQPGKSLVIGQLYTIAATGMPTTMNMQFDHITHASDGTLYVFYEVVATEGDSAGEDTAAANGGSEND